MLYFQSSSAMAVDEDLTEEILVVTQTETPLNEESVIQRHSLGGTSGLSTCRDAVFLDLVI